MSTKKISGLPVAAALVGPEDVPIVQGGATVRTTAADIAALAPAGPVLPLAIAQGGTGQITRQLALDALFGGVAKGSLWLGDGAHITALPVGADGTVLTAASGQPKGVQWTAPVAAALTIGQAIVGGTAGRLLIEGAGPVLSDTANLTWGVAGNNLSVTAATGNPAISITAGGDAANILQAGIGTRFHSGPGTDCQLATPTTASIFTDGPRTVSICDGTNNITYGPGTPANWLAAPPTDVWLALDRLAAWIAANFPIPPAP
jgi:hypothetical protein